MKEPGHERHPNGESCAMKRACPQLRTIDLVARYGFTARRSDYLLTQDTAQTFGVSEAYLLRLYKYIREEAAT